MGGEHTRTFDCHKRTGCAVILFLLSLPAFADPLSKITEGISGLSDNLALGLTMVAAGSSHQFDWVDEWQGSITAATMLDSESDAVSVGLGKRSIGVLWHGSYTRSREDELLVVGGTFRF